MIETQIEGDAIVPRTPGGLPSAHVSAFRTATNRVAIMHADVDNALDTVLIEIEGQQAAFDKAADELASEHETVLAKLRQEQKAQADKLVSEHEAAKATLLLLRDDLLKGKDMLGAALAKAEEIEPRTPTDANE